ncbi:MAG: hypothetical protein FWF63_08565, partial [Fibromonadales bacterium]|nr:hypothetical protein [Fibromonadales bacterium]
IELAKEKAGLKKGIRIDIEHINNFGYSFADRFSRVAKGQNHIYPWLSTLEKTQVWAIYLNSL